jgi:F0F1-type ATP synthase membrane subunit c/vacuolar-type H+-ATPase subunit K
MSSVEAASRRTSVGGSLRSAVLVLIAVTQVAWLAVLVFGLVWLVTKRA